MGFRFRRSIKIAPGFRLNFGKTGMSLSAGIRGASMTFGSRGIYSNVGIPGTGLSYRSRLTSSRKTNVGPRTFDDIPVKTSISLELDENGNVFARDIEGNPLPAKYVKIARDQNFEVVNNWIRDECEKINDEVESILQIHKCTPALDNFREFPECSFPEAQPSPPQLKQITFLCKIFPFIRKKIDVENSNQMVQYNNKLSAWENKKHKFDEVQTRFRYNFEVGRFESLNIMEDFLDDVLHVIGWPRETTINFDIKNNGHKVMIDLDLPEIEDLPNTTAEIAKSGLKINFKKRSETQIRKDYMTHVHGIGFRTLGTVFAALPKASVIILSAFSQRNNPATGEVNDEYLYSVRVNRKDWESINFGNLAGVDVVECLGKFEIIRNMTKTGVFKAIEPLKD